MTATDEAFWNRAARKYAADPIADMAGYERTLARVAELIPPGARVLELGCGTGSTALRLARADGEYLATDLSAEMVRIAREKLAADPRPGLSFDVATAETMAARPENAGAWDVVLGFNWLHLVTDLPGTLAAVRHLLRPGGVFVSKTACLGEMNPLLPLAVRVMRLFGKAPESIGVFDAAGLERAMAEAGFTVGAVERHGSGRKDTRVFIVAR